MGHHNIPPITVNNDETIRLGQPAQKVRMVSLAVGLGGLLLGGLLGMLEGDAFARFFHSYLISFCFFVSLSLGGLFFVALQHLVRAGWSVTVRRISEITAAAVVPMSILFLPILGPMLMNTESASSLYVWNSAEKVATDELVAHKAPYLNAGFFAIRAIFYFLVWGVAARFFLRNSLAQDQTGDAAKTLRMQELSPITLILFALTVTFASFDWLMSLNPHWFSTIFGVYFFAGSIVSFFAMLAVVAVLLQHFGKLNDVITTDHYHDLGKYLFGFTMFWAYIAFSQYLLIWYGNIPEETEWFLVRQNNGWETIALVLIFGHFILPFLGLMSRHVRRRKLLLAAWGVWILAMHWVDLYWIVMPQVSPEGITFGLIDVCCLLGIGGFYLSNLIWIAADRPLVPVQDPWLSESLAFKQV